MTKAEKIFKQTYRDSKDHIARWGTGQGMRWSHLATDEVVYTRTLNAIDKLADAEERRIRDCERYDIIDAEEAELRRSALQMVRNTVEEERERIRVDRAWRKGEITFEEMLAATF